ncbi:hypothetical protein LCGC14_1298990 [marine sediment metagenome]|uniref:FUZ/MON1/HPS1 first Longin domain-containing protein n=1 Tax=marine sediment metagenome TaxID=412755 RepID=A0A0F9N6S4_9ZZZZ|nr:hypothetical protein [bacterium]
MVKLIKDLWILTENGITVFSRVLDPRVNPQLFGALMSAINTFAEKLGEGGISNFEVSEIKFSIIKQKKFLFVATSSKTIKSKKIYNELKYISTQFFELYPEEMLKKWDSDVGLFATFSRSIKDSLEED